jgi:pimeloyl-ACP methyl ester carboxylesterase
MFNDILEKLRELSRIGRVCRRTGQWAILASILACGGCVNRIAANRLIAAPNADFQKNETAWRATWTNFLALVTTNQMVSLEIPVGPPEATISVLEVPPAEYHRKFVERMQLKPGGGGSFTLNVETNALATFTQLPAPATIVALHGYGMMKEGMAPWAFQLAQAGYRVVAIDLRGHGHSTGRTIGFGKFETVDLSQVLDALQSRGLCDERVGVLGVSYGATLALHWAAREPRIRVVVAIAPYDDAELAFERFAKMANLPFPRGFIRRAAHAAAARLDLDWRDWSGGASIRKMNQPVLLITGGKDPICPPEDLERLKAAALGRAQTLVLPEANHYVIGASLDSLAEPIHSWLKQHLRADTGGHSSP